ncbi:hypothetical protein [Paracoccus fontiphilus]|uniref:Uncharacterized protein n=1 Tax=Paracoccus fontiphilus TaxID=1815556 RepID=A0ABV7IMC0_9RHOB|nr:hypothetical protein [Paracoccus fontiphilus]
MDFTSFDSRSVADEGRPLHLRHPSTGELLWDDQGPHLDDDGAEVPREKPCLVYVLGTEGRVAQEAFREAAKLPKLPDDATMQDYHDRLCVTARKLVVGFENVDRNTRAATMADVDWFLALNVSNPVARGKGRSFAEQVLAFSNDRSAFLGKPEASSSAPRSRSAGRTPALKAGRKRAGKT